MNANHDRPVAALTAILVLSILMPGSPVAPAQELEQKPLFVQGVGGYNIYRIPSLIVTQKGTLLAFCEGREAGDSSDIDLLLRRSEDGGQLGAGRSCLGRRKKLCGNPCRLLTRIRESTGWLLTCDDSADSDQDLHEGPADTRRSYVRRSGRWPMPWTRLSKHSSTKRADWWWYATGPGVGIQLRREPHRGRLVIPCDHSSKEGGFASHIIYSDDHGASWQLGGIIPGGCNECQVVELADGSLMLNIRLQKHWPREAGIAISRDGGVTWSKMEPDPTLIDPVCQASLIRYSLASVWSRNRLLFSNPAQTVLSGQSSGERTRMTVRLSYDEGKTWPVSKTACMKGPSAYSV